jgi:hypothetical protein
MTVDELNAHLKYLEFRASIAGTAPVAKAFRKEIATAQRIRRARFGK